MYIRTHARTPSLTLTKPISNTTYKSTASQHVKDITYTIHELTTYTMVFRLSSLLQWLSNVDNYQVNYAVSICLISPALNDSMSVSTSSQSTAE